MAVASELKAQFDTNMLELAPTIYAMRYSIQDSNTTRVVSSGYWIWHIDAKTGYYCKMRIPSTKVLKLGPSLSVSGDLTCDHCGLSGSITGAKWSPVKR
jgi:hypothetical protein